MIRADSIPTHFGKLRLMMTSERGSAAFSESSSNCTHLCNSGLGSRYEVEASPSRARATSVEFVSYGDKPVANTFGTLLGPGSNSNNAQIMCRT